MTTDGSLFASAIEHHLELKRRNQHLDEDLPLDEFIGDDPFANHPLFKTEADARRVVKLLANLNAKVNLIALNPGPGIPFETPDPQRVAAFQNIVRRALPCFLRKPRGLDVYAACGQLKRMELVEIQG